MASDLDFVEYIADQIDADCQLTFKKMFGEYGLYCHGKMVALVCDNRLLIKPTEAGRNYIGDVVEAEPYPGAKPCLLIEDKIEDGEWLSQLLRISYAELPDPKPKKKKKKNK